MVGVEIQIWTSVCVLVGRKHFFDSKYMVKKFSFVHLFWGNDVCVGTIDCTLLEINVYGN